MTPPSASDADTSPARAPRRGGEALCDETCFRLGDLFAGGAAGAGVPAVPGRADPHHRRGELLRLQHHPDHPGLPDPELRGTAALAGHLADLPADRRIRPHHLGADPADRLHRRLLSRFPRPLGDLADGAVSRLHHPVLDLQRHPHDLVDPLPGAQRARQHHAAAARPDQGTARVPAVLRLRRRAGLCPPLHAVHGGADLQLDDAHRPQPARSRARRRRHRLAGAALRHRAAVQARHRHRLDLHRHHRHGRLRHGAHDERRPERLGVADDGERHVAPAVSGGGGQCRGPAAAGPVHRRRHDAHGRHKEGALEVMHGRRGPGFWLLAGFFGLFVLFLYGPTITILVLSFQGPTGGLTFPMQGVSVHWFGNLFEKQMVGDFSGSFERSMALGVAAMLVTVVASFSAGLAFRTRFRGSATIFYLAIASLIVPSVLVSLGIGLLFRVLGWDPAWYSSAFGAHLTWTLPFGLLIMFAVFNRFDRRYEEAARDLGATSWQTIRYIVVPILLPSLIGVGLFGFTLSYDEFARSLYTAGTFNTLPLEIYGMTTNVTTPVLYALGTVTTAVSFAVIALALVSFTWVRRRRERHGSDAGKAA